MKARGGTTASALVRIAIATTAVALLLALVKVVSRWGVWTVWDDAWMFQRYAANVLAGHGVAWNAGEAPTYGLTSLAYLVPAIAARALFGNVAVSVLVVSALSGAAMIVTTAWMTAGADGGRSSRALAFALFASALALSQWPAHIVSGMDTAFGAAYLAVLLGVAHRWQRGHKYSILLGILAGLALWIRPELGLFGGAVGVAAVLWPGPTGRVASARLLGGMAATLGLLLLVASLYFGSALPLPFFTKTSGIYGEGFLRVYRGETTKLLGAFLPPLWPLLSVIALDVALAPRRYFARARPVERAVIVATLAFLAFHLFFAIPIMGFAGRYYQPAIVPLAYLAAQSLGRLGARTRGALGQRHGRLGWTAIVVLGALAPWPFLFAATSDELEGLGNWRRSTGRHDLYAHAKGPPNGYWAKIDQLRNLDDTVVIASTEVGFLGVHQRDKRIIDIAGLHDARYAYGFDPALLVDHDAPDLIYLPHPHYEAMTQALEEHPTFEEKYLAFAPQRVGARDFGVALRRDSPHFETMLQIFDPYHRGTAPTRR
jgi:hypothetical protein